MGTTTIPKMSTSTTNIRPTDWASNTSIYPPFKDIVGALQEEGKARKKKGKDGASVLTYPKLIREGGVIISPGPSSSEMRTPTKQQRIHDHMKANLNEQREVRNMIKEVAGIIKEKQGVAATPDQISFDYCHQRADVLKSRMTQYKNDSDLSDDEKEKQVGSLKKE